MRDDVDGLAAPRTTSCDTLLVGPRSDSAASATRFAHGTTRTTPSTAPAGRTATGARTS